MSKPTKTIRTVQTVSITSHVLVREIQRVQAAYGYASATQAAHEMVLNQVRFMELCRLYELDGSMTSRQFGANCRVLWGTILARLSPEAQRNHAQFCRDETSGKKPK